MNTALRLILTAATVAVCWTSGRTTRAADLAGDPEAVARAGSLLETLGGREVWAGARTVKVELRGFYARQQEPWLETFWLDLEAPNGRFELKGGDVDRVIAWTSQDGWEIADGTLKTMPPDQHTTEMQYWRCQPLVIFHRLALGGADTRVALGEDGRLEVLDATRGELLARFALNQKAEPLKWSAKLGEREIDHVLGPLEAFADARFPRWGSSLDGVWRYEHVSVELSAKPLSVPLDPPKAQDDLASAQGRGGYARRSAR